MLGWLITKTAFLFNYALILVKVKAYKLIVINAVQSSARYTLYIRLQHESRFHDPYADSRIQRSGDSVVTRQIRTKPLFHRVKPTTDSVPMYRSFALNLI